MSYTPPSNPIALIFGSSYTPPSNPISLVFGVPPLLPAYPAPSHIRAWRLAHHSTAMLSRAAAARWHSADPVAASAAAAWALPVQLSAEHAALWLTPDLTPAAPQRLPWARGRGIETALRASWSTPNRHDDSRAAAWADLQLSTAETTGCWALPPAAMAFAAVPFAAVPFAAAQHFTPWQSTAIAAGCDVIAWGPRAATYICRRVYAPPSSPVTLTFGGAYVPPSSPVALIFSTDNEPLVCTSNIGGGLPPPAPTVPTTPAIPIGPLRQRSYVMTHEIKLFRAADDLQVAIRSITLSTDRDSWGWTWSAEMGSRADAQALTASATPARLELDGGVYLLLAESLSESHQFGKPRYTVSGRSLSAVLSADYAERITAVIDSAMTAAQIAQMALPAGWVLDWRLDDWPVPAGAVSLDNLSPIDIVVRVATAGGGRVYSMTDEQVLIVAPAWQYAPWELQAATPDALLHEHVIRALSRRPQANGAQANAVFVRGEQHGVMCKIVRAGSAGDALAGDVVDEMITHVIAARQRGKAVIASTGSRTATEVTLPIMGSLPPIYPGQVVRIEDGISAVNALAVGVSITAKMSPISVTQSVSLLS